MLEFYRDRFVQLLHDAPAKEPVLSVGDGHGKERGRIEPGYDQLVGL